MATCTGPRRRRSSGKESPTAATRRYKDVRRSVREGRLAAPAIGLLGQEDLARVGSAVAARRPCGRSSLRPRSRCPSKARFRHATRTTAPDGKGRADSSSVTALARPARLDAARVLPIGGTAPPILRTVRRSSFAPAPIPRQCACPLRVVQLPLAATGREGRGWRAGAPLGNHLEVERGRTQGSGARLGCTASRASSPWSPNRGLSRR